MGLTMASLFLLKFLVAFTERELQLVKDHFVSIIKRRQNKE